MSRKKHKQPKPPGAIKKAWGRFWNRKDCGLWVVSAFFGLTSLGLLIINAYVLPSAPRKLDAGNPNVASFSYSMTFLEVFATLFCVAGFVYPLVYAIKTAKEVAK